MNNVEGTVVLCLTIGASGKVTDVRPLSGPSQLLQSSVDAAKNWRFEPPRKAPASTTAEIELLDKLTMETVRKWRFKVSSGGKPTNFSVTLSFRIPCLDH